ncbi:Uncharacterised protein [Neisseria meningitidis]|nr:Uncharacterised protein [Neisseria meningitidis]CWM82229.1 Uncharacterised protein [Neisseria meningitidis]CWP27114.1 Uncharacterised protein [Neisseria meningitidis]CWQ05054.1 Uncharacterised protein [Neisseria meningitidis]CWQ89012.1 Uncharacterised protein [Neisseria meningitidis]
MSSAQPDLTLTQTFKNTLVSNSFSISNRASVEIFFKRSPPLPIKIAFWLSLSTKTAI